MNSTDPDPSSPVVPTPSSAPSDAQAPARDTPAAASESTQAAATTPVETAAGAQGGDEQRRRNRNRRRGRRNRGDRAAAGEVVVNAGEGADTFDADDEDDDDGVQAAGDEVAAPEWTPVEVGERFADVVSGAYDSEPAPEPDAEPAKRVLAAMPDAPKLHKVLAQAGIGSRRDMEQLITDGHITVNGEPATSASASRSATRSRSPASR